MYGERLTPMLEAESVLHWDLNRRGHAVALEPDAKSRHQNFERFGASLNLRFQAGRTSPRTDRSTGRGPGAPSTR